MKKIILLMAVSVMATTAIHAQFGNLKGKIKQAVKNEVDEAKVKANSAAAPGETIDAGGVTVRMSGKINHETYVKNQAGTVEFSRIPATVEEFREVQRHLGGEPHGAVALEVMAMEMFLRDQTVGREALALCNTGTNLSSLTGRLKEHVREGDSYAQRYIVASLIKGANPANGYNPPKPYKIQVRVSPTKEYQKGTSFIIGTVIYLEVYREGDDTPWRGVEVYRPQDSNHYVVVNNPAMYVQCKYISPGQTFNGLE